MSHLFSKSPNPELAINWDAYLLSNIITPSGRGYVFYIPMSGDGKSGLVPEKHWKDEPEFQNALDAEEIYLVAKITIPIQHMRGFMKALEEAEDKKELTEALFKIPTFEVDQRYTYRVVRDALEIKEPEEVSDLVKKMSKEEIGHLLSHDILVEDTGISTGMPQTYYFAEHPSFNFSL